MKHIFSLHDIRTLIFTVLFSDSNIALKNIIIFVIIILLLLLPLLFSLDCNEMYHVIIIYLLNIKHSQTIIIIIIIIMCLLLLLLYIYVDKK